MIIGGGTGISSNSSGGSSSSFTASNARSAVGLPDLTAAYIPIYDSTTGKLINSEIYYDSDQNRFIFGTNAAEFGTDTIFLGADTSLSAANGYLSGTINGTKYLFSTTALGAGNGPKFPLQSAGGTRSVQTTATDTLDASSGIANTYTASGDEIIYQITLNPAETGTLTYVIQSTDADGSILRYFKVAVTATGEQTFDINPLPLSNGETIYCTLTGVSVLGSSDDGPYLLASYYTNADTNIAYDGYSPTFAGMTLTDDLLLNETGHNLGSYTAPVSKSHLQSIRMVNTNFSTTAACGYLYSTVGGNIYLTGASSLVNIAYALSGDDISVGESLITIDKPVSFGDSGNLDGDGVVYLGSDNGTSFTLGANDSNEDYPYATITDGTNTFGLMPLYDTPTAADVNDLTTPGIFALPVSGSSRIPSNRDDSITQLAVLSATYNDGASGGYIAFGAGADTSDDQNLLAVRAWTGTTRSDWFYAPLYNSSIALTEGQVLTATGNGSEFEATDQADLSLPMALICELKITETQNYQSDWTERMVLNTQSSMIRTAPDILGWDTYHITIKKSGMYRITFNVSSYKITSDALFRVCTAVGSTTSDVLMGCMMSSEFGYGNACCTGRFQLEEDTGIWVVCYSASQFWTSYVGASGDTSLDVEYLGETVDTGPSAYT